MQHDATVLPREISLETFEKICSSLSEIIMVASRQKLLAHSEPQPVDPAIARE